MCRVFVDFICWFVVVGFYDLEIFEMLVFQQNVLKFCRVHGIE